MLEVNYCPQCGQRIRISAVAGAEKKFMVCEGVVKEVFVEENTVVAKELLARAVDGSFGGYLVLRKDLFDDAETATNKINTRD